LAQNIENFQIQYNGDLDGDGILDGFTDWQTAWTLADIAEIRQIRIWILGRTENPFVSVTGTPPTGMPLVYQRPAIANSPQAADPDNHRRFLIETTANIRNLSLEVYNE
ncbi:MAG: PilW family protein, partial [Candidatus Aminicenantia bacterium]